MILISSWGTLWASMVTDEKQWCTSVCSLKTPHTLRVRQEQATPPQRVLFLSTGLWSVFLFFMYFIFDLCLQRWDDLVHPRPDGGSHPELAAWDGKVGSFVGAICRAGGSRDGAAKNAHRREDEMWKPQDQLRDTQGWTQMVSLHWHYITKQCI